MKKVFTVILLLFSFTMLKAQEEGEEKESPYLPELMNASWFKAIFEKSPDYFKVRKDFEAYLRANPSVKSKQRRDVERWLEKTAFLLDEQGRVNKPSAVLPVKTKMPVSNAALSTLAGTYPYSGSWKMIGPFQFCAAMRHSVQEMQK